MAEPKRRGRPYLDGSNRSIPVTVPLPPEQFDRLCVEAQRRGEKLPQVIRRKLAKADASDDEDD